MEEKKIGEVLDYYVKVSVAALTLEAPLSAGDTIHVKGHTTDITQKVESIQIEHKSVTSAKKGEDVGIKIRDRARKGDVVYKVLD